MSYNGLEIDTLSLGDADCIIVTQWRNGVYYRLLVDGGCASDADAVLGWLIAKGFTFFDAALCTHLHNDHAAGMAKIIRDSRITFLRAYMHDIRQHALIDDLRRAARKDDDIKQALELTEELHAAFLSRGVTPVEPFTGTLAGMFDMSILGPSRSFYKEILADAMPALPVLSSLFAAPAPVPANRGLYGTLSSPPPATDSYGSLLGLYLSKQTSLEAKPKTQVFNETSVILGIRDAGCRALLTGDAGCRALKAVGPEWNALISWTYRIMEAAETCPHRTLGVFGQRTRLSPLEGTGPGLLSAIRRPGPDDAVVSALCKAGSKVASTHRSGNLWFSVGDVPPRPDYSTLELMEGKGSPIPVSSVPATHLSSLLHPFSSVPGTDWSSMLSALTKKA